MARINCFMFNSNAEVEAAWRRCGLKQICTMMANDNRQRLYFILTLVLFIKGHQGFFIKHFSTGLCLQSATQWRLKGNNDDPSIDHQWGPVYVVHFNTTCLHPDAQFRFLEPFSVLHNIGKNGTMLTRYKENYFKKFHIYHSPQPRIASNFIYTKQFALKQTKAGALELLNGFCATPRLPGNTSIGPIIPQNGDTVYGTTDCDKEEQIFTFGQITKEGENMTDVNCSPGQVMKIKKAEYGQFSNENIFVPQNNADCNLQSTCIVKDQCDGRTSCNINVDRSLFKNYTCPERGKQLYMEYKCVDYLTRPIISVRKVRLSQLPNEGFIEIFDGTTWIKVDDTENWNERKNTALCYHLGYKYTRKSANSTKKISAGETIGSGDVYCMFTQATNQSCCANLYPSTLTQESTIPYTTCKICDKPLLQNSTKFPDHTFSASDSSGHEARLSNNGWCPQRSGTQYLQIDLQRIYFISHIATFGNKEQTKWTTSYELQYSRTLRELRFSGKKTITTNQPAYRASITVLNIVYARFLKITVKHGNTICFRVQLCGQAFYPGPVENFDVYNITAQTANISWTLPQSQGFSDVTYFLITLEDHGLIDNVTRGNGDYQYMLNNLKPYKNYAVSIGAGNVYGFGDVILKTFITNCAAATESESASEYNGGPKTSLFVIGVVFSLGLNAVLIILVLFLTARLCRSSQTSTSDEVGEKDENNVCNDDVYENPELDNTSTTYDALELDEEDEHTYQYPL